MITALKAGASTLLLPCYGLPMHNLKIGQLTVQALATTDKPRGLKNLDYWTCLCSCGNITILREDALRKPNGPRSCGCLKHTLLKGERWSKLYGAWRGLRARCNNPNTPYYKYYGGRGIKVCSAWDTYAQFKVDMGPHPGDGFSIDRIDVHGDYEPSNCRWATQSQQMQNTQRHSQPYLESIRAGKGR